MTPEQSANNKAIAAWLNENHPAAQGSFDYANFYESEEMNAILRDAMLAAGWRLALWIQPDGQFGVYDLMGMRDVVVAADYKTAIVGAFLLFMQAKGGRG